MELITDPKKVEQIFIEIFEDLLGRHTDSKFNKPYLTTDDIIQLTGWSKRTIQELRDDHEIPYIKHKRKILYPRDEILDFLNAHTVCTTSE